MGHTEYVDRIWKVVLASAYVGVEEYDKAIALAEEINAMNAESIDDELVMSLLYRYRDKDYQRAVDACVDGLNKLSKLEDAYNLVASKGYTLSMQKTLNLIMQGKYADAYESAEECCTYQMDAMETVDSQSRDLWAILALATQNTEKYKEFETEIKESGEYGIPFSKDVTDYKDGKITLEEIVMSGRYDLL
jgi:tetratricopeptide (TPR) repeat protein